MSYDDPAAVRAALDRHGLAERVPRGRRHTRTRWYRGRLGQFASVQVNIDLSLAGGGYLGAWLPPTATVGQAQNTL